MSATLVTLVFVEDLVPYGGFGFVVFVMVAYDRAEERSAGRFEVSLVEVKRHLGRKTGRRSVSGQ